MGLNMLDVYQEYLSRIEKYRSYGYDLEKERDWLIELGKPYGRILEVGTGKGYLTLALARKGYKFTTLDIDAQVQDFAKENLRKFNLEKKVNFIVCDITDLEVKNEYEKFDTIISANVIHHLEKPLLVFNYLIGLILPKAKIVLSDFNKKGFQVVEAIHRSEGSTHQHNINYFNLSQVEKFFLDKEFKVKKYSSGIQDLIIAIKE